MTGDKCSGDKPIEQDTPPVAPPTPKGPGHRDGPRRLQRAIVRSRWEFEKSREPRQQLKVGRNGPCPCGMQIDGKPVKYKNCCGE